MYYKRKELQNIHEIAMGFKEEPPDGGPIVSNILTMGTIYINTWQISSTILRTITWHPSMPLFLVSIIKFMTGFFTLNVTGLMASPECMGQAGPLGRWWMAMLFPWVIGLLFLLFHACAKKKEASGGEESDDGTSAAKVWATAGTQIVLVLGFEIILNTSFKAMDCLPCTKKNYREVQHCNEMYRQNEDYLYVVDKDDPFFWETKPYTYWLMDRSKPCMSFGWVIALLVILCYGVGPGCSGYCMAGGCKKKKWLGDALKKDADAEDKMLAKAYISNNRAACTNMMDIIFRVGLIGASATMFATTRMVTQFVVLGFTFLIYFIGITGKKNFTLVDVV